MAKYLIGHIVTISSNSWGRESVLYPTFLDIDIPELSKKDFDKNVELLPRDLVPHAIMLSKESIAARVMLNLKLHGDEI